MSSVVVVVVGCCTQINRFISFSHNYALVLLLYKAINLFIPHENRVVFVQRWTQNRENIFPLVLLWSVFVFSSCCRVFVFRCTHTFLKDEFLIICINGKLVFLVKIVVFPLNLVGSIRNNRPQRIGLKLCFGWEICEKSVFTFWKQGKKGQREREKIRKEREKKSGENILQTIKQ